MELDIFELPGALRRINLEFDILTSQRAKDEV